MTKISPAILIVSNRYDFSTDFICIELNKQCISYWRMNRDELDEYTIDFDPINCILIATYKDIIIEITSSTLKTIYYRAPTFLRDIYQDAISEEDQLKRTQWIAFIRSLLVFEKVNWVNNPVNTYQAEIKALQLYKANQIGFKIPATKITNKMFVPPYAMVAVKSIDTAILNLEDEEGFVYTEIYDKSEIVENHFGSPFFVQEGLVPKVDIRVTVAGDQVIAAKIVSDQDCGVDMDWRRFKDKLNYEIISLPKDVEKKCLQLVRELNLSFGGIDLVLHKNAYYFIEINPTGEWSWLQQNTGFRYDRAIVEALKKSSNE